MRVLFVDDDPAIRRSIARVTKRGGVPADFADSGEEALKLARNIYYPVVVTDLRMPGMDGVELMRAMRDVLPDAVFVVITGQDDIDVPVERALREAVASILEKPWDEDELLDTLHRAMRLWEQRRGRTAQPANEQEGERILLLEDDDADYAVLKRLLRGATRPAIVRATRLSDAMELLEKAPYDVIISDLTLPDARGLDTVLRLQNSAPNCPIIVLSGSADDTVALQAIRAGAQDFLVKGSIDAPVIERAIRYATERKNSEQRLTLLALNDPLTGLANRTALRQQLQQRLRRARRTVDAFALLFIDLDEFKPVNDRLGHAAGDALLVEVSRRLKGVVREYDTVARLGGDEFAIILDALPDGGGPIPVAERLLTAVAAPVALPEGEARVSASIGVAIYPQSAGNAEALLRAADQAMYRAKAQGKNAYCIHRQSMPPVSVHPGALGQADLPPQGLLVRYRRHHHGRNARGLNLSGEVCIQGPDGPRPMLHGQLQGELGRLAVRAACADLARMRRAGVLVQQISLPATAAQLDDPELPAALRRALELEGLRGGCIELGFDEATVLGDIDRCGAAEALEEAGGSLAIREFGSGQISLPRLFALPAQRAWVTPSIVSRTCAGDPAMLRALSGMCIPLGIELCAAGVQQATDRDALLEAGCDQLCGPLFGDAHTAAELIAVHREHRGRA